MTTITFDTQELVIELESSGFTRQQSEAVVSVLKKSQGELATKADSIKWVGALMLAQVAVIAALVKLL